MRPDENLSSEYLIPDFACITVVFLLCMVLSAGCVGAFLHGADVVSPHIVPVQNAPAPPAPVYTFPFERSTVTLTMPVNGSVYAGAKGADKEVTIYGNVSERDWIAQSYLSMMNDPNQEEFYRDLLTRFREIKDRNGLADDEYLELMTVFVQSIRYETVGENPPKFPIETFVERSGDCDDKSLLLAGLISREGYRTVLFSFPAEGHMAVGITCPGMQYRDTGYAYTETTNMSLVGIAPDGLNGGVVLQSAPIVIPVGDGTKTFGKCDQTRYLHDMYVTSEKKVDELTSQALGMKSELEALSSARNVNAYNLRVPIYNSLIGKRNKYAEIHNYILSHQYDRKGTYEWVKNNAMYL